MKKISLFISLCLFALLPPCAFAQYQPMQAPSPQAAPAAAPQAMPQSVEDPDSDDDDGMAAPGSPAPAPKDEAPPPPPVKPDVKQEAPPGVVEGDAGYEQVVLQGLNKVTARAQTIEAPIGSVVRFGTIEIVAHSCWKSAPDERPENAALLEISEIRQGEAPSRIFLGWMFSSSPGLSALEHPFYDSSVVKCEKAAEETKPEPPPAKPPAASKNPAAKKPS